MLTFLFKKTPARLALAITLLYALLYALLVGVSIFLNLGDSVILVIMIPIAIMGMMIPGCGGNWFWGSPNAHCPFNGGSIFIVIFGMIFVLLWVILKIIFFIAKDK